MSLLRSFSSDTPDSGFLLTTVLSAQNNYPIDGASVSIANESDPDTILEELSTNSIGQTPDLSVATPPIDYSLKPDEPVSYTHLRAHETLRHLVCRLLLEKKFFLMIRRPPRSTHCISSAASDVYKRQIMSPFRTTLSTNPSGTPTLIGIAGGAGTWLSLIHI